MTVYDAGVVIGAERSDRRIWAEHRVRLEAGLVPLTTAPVVGQVRRSGRQAGLRRFLRGCRVLPFAATDGHEVGALAGRAGSSDVVDVHLVAVAARMGLPVLTSDVQDLRPIAEVVRPRVVVLRA